MIQQDWWMTGAPPGGGGGSMDIDINAPIAGLPSGLDTMAGQVAAIQALQSGAMLKSVYDTDSNNIVDWAQAVDGGYL